MSNNASAIAAKLNDEAPIRWRDASLDIERLLRSERTTRPSDTELALHRLVRANDTLNEVAAVVEVGAVKPPMTTVPARAT